MSTAPDGPPPPTLGPRPYHYTADDHRGVVLTISILFVVYSLLVLAMRLASKYRNMGVEDWLAVAATTLALPHFIAIMIATVDGGFGSSYTLLSGQDTHMVARSLRAGDVFFLLALFVGKCSAIWLCRRLFALGQHRNLLFCEVTMALCALWCVGSIIAVTTGCTSTEVIRAVQGRCSGLVTRWIVIGLFDALLEFLILGLSIIVIFPLHMSVQRKVQASLCFFLRLPIIILICLQIKYVADFDTASNAGIALTRPILLRQSEVLYSLLSAAIPALNQYLRKFDTTQATVFGYNANTHGSTGRSSAYQMDSLDPGQRSKNGNSNTNTKNYSQAGTDEATDDDQGMGKSTGINFVPANHAQYHASVEGPQSEGFANDGRSHASHEEGSLGRHNSDEFIIRKDVEYTVRHEDR
ncbi:hypothetical protein G647_01837 [Cladophialophora carrionii CBS 160.54]|uniref:Rhodopsin domain-containing protein n=1 Tax=Cladophialophora carrionii CBS 160.54 TaxID=1279043 RepID=V9DR85_9EURO|nr:uncharacterized protein G647_01837 [Cladophialophora carrionii CBS 160.54]ETI29384.1 hypothetical protein G647_01837 [Cladophialophora carrionii CBS 160.54]